MNQTVTQVSRPARVAQRGEAIDRQELALATRNHGMPLEALRYDVTPAGLHYVLVHYDIPECDTHTWVLEIGGHVERQLRLPVPALEKRHHVTALVTIECAGNGRARMDPRPVSMPWLDEAVGTAAWTGTPLGPLLREAGLREGAMDVVFTGADRGLERGVEQQYQRALPLTDALSDEVLLVWAMNGHPLLPQHGHPLRLVVPGWYGMAHVKWLHRIEVLDHEFAGFQNATAYRFKDGPDDIGVPVTRIRPRALMEPPGIPDFMSRVRVVHRGELPDGRLTLRGRAWSGRAPVVRVEVSHDDATSWNDAAVEPREAPRAWHRWAYPWEDPAPGSYALRCRATDASGDIQPVTAQWNVQGMANNSAQSVPLIVTD